MDIFKCSQLKVKKASIYSFSWTPSGRRGHNVPRDRWRPVVSCRTTGFLWSLVGFWGNNSSSVFTLYLRYGAYLSPKVIDSSAYWVSWNANWVSLHWSRALKCLPNVVARVFLILRKNRKVNLFSPAQSEKIITCVISGLKISKVYFLPRSLKSEYGFMIFLTF